MEESQDLYNSDKEKASLPEKTRPNSPSTRSSYGRHSPFIRQTRILTSRTLVTTYRDPMGMLGSLVEAILMGIISGWVFYQLGRDQSGIRSREGVLYNASALQGYLILLFEVYRLS